MGIRGARSTPCTFPLVCRFPRVIERACAPLKVSLVSRRGWGVVGREGEGRQQGTGPHQQKRKEKKGRGKGIGKQEAVGLGGDQKSSAQVAVLIPCEAGASGPAGRPAGWPSYASLLLEVLDGIPENSAPGTTSFFLRSHARDQQKNNKKAVERPAPSCHAAQLAGLHCRFPAVSPGPVRFLCGRLPHTKPATPSERRAASESPCRPSAADLVVRAPVVPSTHARAVSCAPPWVE